jgi:hypothetical protein
MNNFAECDYRTTISINDDSMDVGHKSKTRLVIKCNYLNFRTRLRLMFSYGFRALTMAGISVELIHPDYSNRIIELFPGDEYNLNNIMDFTATGLKNGWSDVKKSYFPMSLEYNGRIYRIHDRNGNLEMENR